MNETIGDSSYYKDEEVIGNSKRRFKSNQLRTSTNMPSPNSKIQNLKSNNPSRSPENRKVNIPKRQGNDHTKISNKSPKPQNPTKMKI